MADSFFFDRWVRLGKEWDRQMAIASIQRCNCMVRYKDSPQMPAIRNKKNFTDPEGFAICEPDSFEDMHYSAIQRLMDGRNEVYIGHMIR